MEIVWKDCANPNEAECPVPVAALFRFLSVRFAYGYSLFAPLAQFLPLRPARTLTQPQTVALGFSPWYQ